MADAKTDRNRAVRETFRGICSEIAFLKLYESLLCRASAAINELCPHLPSRRRVLVNAELSCLPCLVWLWESA